MSEPTDREVAERAQRGDAAAIGDLFSRYWRAARAAAFGITGEFASAEDAAADAFQQALAGLPSLRDPDRFGAWLRTIVIRKARATLSRPAVADASAAGLADQNPRPDEALLQLELAALVQQATRDLPAPLREAVALVYFEGYDTESAARFLDIPSGTVRRRLHDGRARLRTTVERLLQEGGPGNGKREREIQRLEAMLNDGDIYAALRGALMLRPASRKLIEMIRRRRTAQPVAAEETSHERLRSMVLRLLQPSSRLQDPNHPVGSMAAAIRKALPEFREWDFPGDETALRLMTAPGEDRDSPQIPLPPGFAGGRPGSFLRASRGLVRASVGGRIGSLYEHLHDSPDQHAFCKANDDFRLSDVLDLIWMTATPLDLRSVQELLERLISAVLPPVAAQFSPYDEPRYRSALQLQLGRSPARAASGGVLAPWPRCPAGAHAAHLRLFLEAWATLRSGQVIELDPL